MQIGTKVKNKNNGKSAEFIKQDETHTWVKIDGIETCIPNNLFKKVYEVKND